MPAFFICEEHNKKLGLNIGRKGQFFACPNYFRRDGYAGDNWCNLTISTTVAKKIMEAAENAEVASKFCACGLNCKIIYRNKDSFGFVISKEEF